MQVALHDFRGISCILSFLKFLFGGEYAFDVRFSHDTPNFVGRTFCIQ